MTSHGEKNQAYYQARHHSKLSFAAWRPGGPAQKGNHEHAIFNFLLSEKSGPDRNHAILAPMVFMAARRKAAD